MFRWLKKYFVPHKGNNHHPHMLRREGRLFVLSAIFVLEILFTASFLVLTKTQLLGNIVSNVLIDYANSGRAEENLSPLKENPVLDKAAEAKASDMAEKGYFAHVSPDGKDPWYWLKQAGYKFSYAGENLAVNFFDTKDLADAWMNSPTHRANIMNGNFTEIGIGMAEGNFEGHETVFVVEFFGRPASSVSITGSTPVVTNEGKTASDMNVKGETMEVTSSEALVETTPVLGIKSMVVSPRQAVNGFYYILLGLVALALILMFIVKVEIPRTWPILNGFLLMLILAGVVFMNHLIASVVQTL